jgi:hypothetical protein
MGNFDAASVIQAAATSNLGVVSLIVLVLAFLAWRFFQRSDDRVKLIAFAMMFLGAAGFVAAAMLAGGDAEDEASESVPLQVSASPRAEAPASADTGSVEAGSVPDIAGEWRDPEGYRFVFTQDGNAFTYRTYLGDEQVGGGAGTLAGRRLSYRFTDEADRNEGTCEAELADDARRISGSCGDGSAEWDFSIRR